MTLKHVHTVFIVAATALAALCAEEAFTAFEAMRTTGMAAATAGSLGAAVFLATYEVRFLQRSRREAIR
jgi:hypothetical protein